MPPRVMGSDLGSSADQAGVGRGGGSGRFAIPIFLNQGSFEGRVRYMHIYI